MIISFEASANVDTTYFGYFSMIYDQDFFNDIKVTLTEIPKDDILKFSMDTEKIKLLFGEIHTIRRVINIASIEKDKFSDVFKINFNSLVAQRFISVSLNIDRDYFYFTAFYESKKDKRIIEFQSLNFDVRFIDILQSKYIKCQESMVN
jgi:hypothetical protein